MAKAFPVRYTAQADDDSRPVSRRHPREQAVEGQPMVARRIGHAENASNARSTSGTGLSGLPIMVRPDDLARAQYRRDFESLDRFARDKELPHHSGDVGIWHETYRVNAGAYEAVFGNMPVFGLAAATTHVPVGRKAHTAAARIGAGRTDEPAVEPYRSP